MKSRKADCHFRLYVFLIASLISLTRQILKLQKEVDRVSRRFPMLDGPDIDWTTAEKIYIMYKALYTNNQTLERIAERGGFGWGEVKLMAKNC